MKKNFFLIGFCSVLFYFCSCNNSNTAKTQSEASTEPELKSISINGDSIHYIDIGTGEPIVLVHGAMADYSLSQTTRDLTELINALNLNPVHLVGHSSGAYAALLTTIGHPELVRSLTLGEPPVMSLLNNVPGGDTLVKNFRMAVIPAIEAFKNNEDEKAAEIFINTVMGDNQYFAKHPKRIREIMMANTVHSKGTSLYPTTGFPPISCDDLRKIKTPVLLVTGDKSPLFVTSIIKELDRCLSNKEKATLSNTSHGLEFENPVEFNKAVLSFIDKH